MQQERGAERTKPSLLPSMHSQTHSLLWPTFFGLITNGGLESRHGLAQTKGGATTDSGMPRSRGVRFSTAKGADQIFWGFSGSKIHVRIWPTNPSSWRRTDSSDATRTRLPLETKSFKKAAQKVNSRSHYPCIVHHITFRLMEQNLPPHDHVSLRATTWKQFAGCSGF